MEREAVIESARSKRIRGGLGSLAVMLSIAYVPVRIVVGAGLWLRYGEWLSFTPCGLSGGDCYVANKWAGMAEIMTWLINADVGFMLVPALFLVGSALMQNSD